MTPEEISQKIKDAIKADSPDFQKAVRSGEKAAQKILKTLTIKEMPVMRKQLLVLTLFGLLLGGCSGYSSYRVPEALPDGQRPSLHIVYLAAGMNVPMIAAIYECTYQQEGNEPLVFDEEGLLVSGHESAQCSGPTYATGPAGSEIIKAAMISGALVYGLGNQDVTTK